jgi:hypothetical protein
MGKKSQAKKIPKYAPGIHLAAGKEPNISVSLEGPTHPMWRLNHLDWDGPWCPSKCKDAGVRGILEKLANLESLSWTQIQSSTGSHFVSVDNIIKQARERISALKKEQWADNLFSIRLSNKERLWGFQRSGIFHVLWWDPEHQIYPSHKKNT